MVDEQTKRRDINKITRAYLIGTRYLEESKLMIGRPKLLSSFTITGNKLAGSEIHFQKRVL